MVVHQMVQEVDGESSVYLAGVFDVLALLDKRLKHFKATEVIDRGLFLHRLFISHRLNIITISTEDNWYFRELARLVNIHPRVPSSRQFCGDIMDKEAAHHALFLVCLILVEHILLALHGARNRVVGIKIYIPVVALGMHNRKRES